jgi:type I restriction enzyme S subunit
MTAARLLKHFDRVAEAPDAVPRLRRFILDLAVRGTLVAQDRRDEPAAELLSRIQCELATHKTGSRRKNEAAEGLPDSEPPFSLPSNWQWSTLARVGIVSPRNFARDDKLASFVPMTLISADYGQPSQHDVRSWGEIKSGYTHIANGDVALAKITPCFENGKSTVFRGLTGDIGAGSTELHVIRPALIDANFILVFLKSPFFIANGIPRMTGTAGQKRVPADYFARSPFPVPPLAEQERIVARVDELMALCDLLEAAQAERERRCDLAGAAAMHRLTQPGEGSRLRQDVMFYVRHSSRFLTTSDRIDTLRSVILDLAVNGKLTLQDPNDEPAPTLMHRIDLEKDRLEGRGEIQPPAKPSFSNNDPPSYSVPAGWQVTPVYRLLLELRTGPFGSSLHQADYRKGGTPVINPASIRHGELVPIETMAVDADTVERLATFKLRKDDIVMARRGEMGRCAVVSQAQEGWLCGTGSLILRVPSCISAQYLAMLIGSPQARDYLTGFAVGVTMQNLNQSILLGMTIALPPYAEQLRILAKAEELMALCDRLEAQIVAGGTISSRLLHALLHEALDTTGAVA